MPNCLEICRRIDYERHRIIGQLNFNYRANMLALNDYNIIYVMRVHLLGRVIRQQKRGDPGISG